ncbi:hypothetical protein ACIPY6_03030 [Streptomyces sp. NPDC090054]|uniref:hypothetical protein n=1 Tax=Streptomyces sp. NPDC090054 TaxID=3365933 RepID=UPI00380DEF58
MGRFWTWLHRHGVARTLNSGTHGNKPDVDQLMQGRSWTPTWLITRASGRSFRRTYPGRAAQLRLAQVERHAVAADGTRRWRLHYRPTR